MPDSYISDFEIDDYHNEYYDDDSYTDFQSNRSRDKNYRRPTLRECLARRCFCDITIKVGSKKFELHRIVLMLNSNYFEKLFTADFVESESKELELNGIEEDIFSKIVELMYNGEHVQRISDMNKKNFVSLLIAMDYLQMEINLGYFQLVIRDDQGHFLLPMDDMFKLYNFLHLHQNFEPLLLQVLSYFSKCLLKISSRRDFLSLPCKKLCNILAVHNILEDDEGDTDAVETTCTKWICEDIQDRIQYLQDLVNIVKFSRYDPFYITKQNTDPVQFDDQDPIRKRNKVHKHFHKLLTYHGEIYLAKPPKTEIYCDESRSTNDNLINAIDKEMKSEEILNNEFFYDVLVTAGSKVFRLHRLQLSLASRYFHELFTENVQKSEEVQLPDEIDEVTFLEIIRYMYYKKIKLTDESNFIGLLQADEILGLGNGFFQNCKKYIESNVKTIKSIFQLLSFTCKKTSISDLYRIISRYLRSLWPKIHEDSNFLDISIDQLAKILEMPDIKVLSEEELRRMCVKWVTYNVKIRYNHLPELAMAINRNKMMECEDYRINENENFDYYSVTDVESHVEQKLREILSCTKLISPSTVSVISLDPERKPFFLASKGSNTCFANVNLRKIVEPEYNFVFPERKEASTLMNENLITSVKVSRGNLSTFHFNCFNFSTQKCISLAVLRSQFTYGGLTTLFTCKNNIYFQVYNELSKYSTELNHWFTFDRSENATTWHTTDGKIIYKFFGHNRPTTSQFYDERTKSWMSCEYENLNLCLPLSSSPVDMGIIDENLSILYPECTTILDRRSCKWRTEGFISDRPTKSNDRLSDDEVPVLGRITDKFTAFKQHKNTVLYMVNETDMYTYYPQNNTWGEEVKTVGDEFGGNKFRAVHYID